MHTHCDIISLEYEHLYGYDEEPYTYKISSQTCIYAEPHVHIVHIGEEWQLENRYNTFTASLVLVQVCVRRRTR